MQKLTKLSLTERWRALKRCNKSLYSKT